MNNMNENECRFYGNLTRDPKITPTANGSYVVNFGMATNRSYLRSNGERASEATYLEMEAWDSGAQRIAENFRKGDPILVKASAKNVYFMDKEGVERSRIVFRVNKFYPILKINYGDNEGYDGDGKD